MHSVPSTADIREIATELGFDISEETIESCRDEYDDLLDSTAPWSGEPDPTGSTVESDDEYNALLATFDSPKTTVEEGPLAGLSLGIKDNIAVAGLPLTCALTGAEYEPETDATVVSRLLEAGAGITGKTNMDALAIGPGGQMSEIGPVSNPRYPDRVPGGSSAGSAAAVAAGLVDAALGTDTGGSIRKPAAYCELVGFKPTHGTLPAEGLVDLAPSLDTIGPITHDVETAASVFAAMAGDPDGVEDQLAHAGDTIGIDRAVSGSADEVTIGIPAAFVEPAEDPVREAFENWRSSVEATPGFSVVDVDLSNDISRSAYPIIIAAEFASIVRQRGVPHGLSTTPDEPTRTIYRRVVERGLNDHIASRMLNGAVLDSVTDGDAYYAARAATDRYAEELETVLGDVDALATPTAPVVPPRLDDVMSSKQVGQSDNTRPFNLAGVPTVALPVEAELPVSVQVTTAAGDDWEALAIARAIESDVDATISG